MTTDDSREQLANDLMEEISIEEDTTWALLDSAWFADLRAERDSLTTQLATAQEQIAVLRPIFDYWWNVAETLDLLPRFQQISVDDVNQMTDLCLAAQRLAP